MLAAHKAHRNSSPQAQHAGIICDRGPGTSPSPPGAAASTAACVRRRRPCRVSAPRYAASRSSRWKCSSRSASSRPASTASRTAQPGSPPCAQSREAAVRRQRRDVVEGAATADSSPHGCSSRMPGVSISSAPPGSSTSCRAVVVCRPLPSSSLIAPTRSDSAPSQAVHQRRLANAGRAKQRDRLRRTQVRRERVEPGLLERADGDDVDHRQPRADRLARGHRIVAEIGLVQARPPGSRRHPTPSSDSAPAGACSDPGQRRDEEDDVDVGGDDLFFDGAPGRRARHRAAAIETDVDDAVVDADPVADRWESPRR